MSTDLERELRDLLSADAGSAPAPHDAGGAVRRTRRRQAVVGAGMVVAIVAIAVGTSTVLGVVDRSPHSVPGVATRTERMNGVGIAIPENWVLIDPDEAGFNGPTGLGTPELPRMILALAPFDPGELFACPGMAADPHTLLMTLQEAPLAVAGPDAATWPVGLEPLDVGDEESSCYPGWDFLRAGWTASGRTFEARVGLAPDVMDADRAALVAAFESLTFEPAGAPATSVVIGTGEAGGEPWELIATRGSDGLELSLQGDSWGGGVGGFDPSLSAFGFVEHLLGAGVGAERLAFTAIPAEVETIEVVPTEATSNDVSFDALRFDVPAEIDARFDALVVRFTPGATGEVRLLDADGAVVASAPVGTGDAGSGNGGTDGTDPTGPANPPPATTIEHGGTSWGLYLAVAADAEDPALAEWIERAEAAGYTTGAGELVCDDGAAAELGVPPDWFGVAVYFASREDAEAGSEWFATNGGAPYGIARVTTYCLD